MNILKLQKVEHDYKIRDILPQLEPNVFEDTIFEEDGELIGFYIKKMPDKLIALSDIADKEFRCKNVPKQEIIRSLDKNDFGKGNRGLDLIKQLSTTLGYVAPKAHMRRPYPTISSTHKSKTASTFIKSMILLSKEFESILKEILPNQYNEQLKLISEKVEKKWRFGNMFTSTISNYNISAPLHQDRANLKGCVNFIINKKYQATGGDLFIPDFNAVINSSNNSLTVYPAFKHTHGVTPIKIHRKGGYRNTHIFYSVKQVDFFDSDY